MQELCDAGTLSAAIKQARFSGCEEVCEHKNKTACAPHAYDPAPTAAVATEPNGATDTGKPHMQPMQGGGGSDQPREPGQEEPGKAAERAQAGEEAPVGAAAGGEAGGRKVGAGTGAGAEGRAEGESRPPNRLRTLLRTAREVSRGVAFLVRMEGRMGGRVGGRVGTWEVV